MRTLSPDILRERTELRSSVCSLIFFGGECVKANQRGSPGRRLLAALLSLSLLCLSGQSAAASPVDEESVRETMAVSAALEPGNLVVPMGRAVGIKLFSNGVLVVGMSSIETKSGSTCPGKNCGLREGDVITHVNGGEVDTIEEVQAAMARHEGEPLTIQALRGKKRMQLKAAPVENQRGVYQLGVWLRDSMAGIGTMTFYDPDTGLFAALGHGINDVDTAILMPLERGSIMEASVTDVKRGSSGDPGELHGVFDLTGDLGQLYANTRMGIFGTIPANKALEQTMEPVPVAHRDEIKTGPATILSNVRGDRVEEFRIEITKVERDGEGTKNMMLRVTDPRLLELTGGIVQGQSGSPILQDGKLIGAVTHVLVNDPTRGYGIFIENMMDAAQ